MRWHTTLLPALHHLTTKLNNPRPPGANKHKPKPPDMSSFQTPVGMSIRNLCNLFLFFSFFFFLLLLHLLDAGRLLRVVEGRARGGELHERPDRLDRLVPGQQERRLGGRVLYSISISISITISITIYGMYVSIFGSVAGSVSVSIAEVKRYVCMYVHAGSSRVSGEKDGGETGEGRGERPGERMVRKTTHDRQRSGGTAVGEDSAGAPGARQGRAGEGETSSRFLCRIKTSPDVFI